MPCASTMTVESHRSAATLYATGELTAAGVLQAATCIEGLPEHVRALRVDLRGVRSADSHAMRALEAALRDWRAARRGMSRVKLAEDTDTTLIAIKFAHQRWSPSIRPALRPSGESRAFRFREHREAVVTRSLRERAGSETR
jgi:ABC-type transporter Mla MlaB component